jgi:hypothetical protein
MLEEMKRPLPNWMPSAEHIIPKKDGGRLRLDNVRLAHRGGNREDYAKTVRKKRRRKASAPSKAGRPPRGGPGFMA